jgi:DNA-binding NarL/FixJ family response regulator
MKKIEILIADDHAIIRDALRRIIAETQDLVVAGEADCGQHVLELVRQRDWNLIVLDLSMPGRNGIDLIKMIKSERPRLPILIFSMHQEEQYAIRAIRAGAAGYLSKEGDSELLLPAMRKVAHGGTFISPKVSELLIVDISHHSNEPRHNLLTDREHEVFMRMIRGTSLTEIANELALSVKTVSTHKAHLFSKLEINSHVELVRYALEHRLIEAVQPE